MLARNAKPRNAVSEPDCYRCGGFGWSLGCAPVVALSERSPLPWFGGCFSGSLLWP
jgi:hypothetical protein